MRVLICGGRDFLKWHYLEGALDIIAAGTPITCVISGGAKGADTLAEYWAYQRGIQREIYQADWTQYGKAAGAIRNSRMLKEGKPELVIAFPGGKGTANMIEQATAANIPIIKLDGITYEAAGRVDGSGAKSIKRAS